MHATVSRFKEEPDKGEKKFHDTNIRQPGGWFGYTIWPPSAWKCTVRLYFTRILSKTKLISK